MPTSIKLIRGSDELDLYGGDDDIYLARDGWVRAVAPNGSHDYTPVAEALTLQVDAANAVQMNAAIQKLDDKVRETQHYVCDFAEEYPVWLRTQLGTESTYQAEVLSARSQPTETLAQQPAAGGFLGQYTLGLERTPWWEDTSSTWLSAAQLDCLGGIWNMALVTPITGDVPARVDKIISSASVGGPLYEFWVGFRSGRFGNIYNFESVWECEDGTLSNSTSIGSEVDYSAHGGATNNKATCDFSADGGDPTWLERVRVTTYQAIGSNYDDQRGTYQVLLRAKVGASTTVEVRLKDGFSGGSNWNVHDRQEISSTSWYLYSLGEVTIPPTRGQTDAAYVRNYALRIDAARTSGSNSLDMDCFVLIPKAEGFVHSTGGDGQRIFTLPEGRIDGWVYSSGYPSDVASVSPVNWSVPTGYVRLVFAAQRQTQSYYRSSGTTDRASIDIYYVERWRTVRGSE